MAPFHWLQNNFISLSNFRYKKINLRNEIEGEWEKWLVSVKFSKDGVTEPKFGTQKELVKCNYTVSKSPSHAKNIRHQSPLFLIFDHVTYHLTLLYAIFPLLK